MLKKNKESLYVTMAIIAIFCLDLVLYFHFVNVSVVKSILLLFEGSVFIYYMKAKDKMKKINVESLIILYLILLFIRLFIDFALKGRSFLVYQNTITVFVFFIGLEIIPFVFFSNVRIAINKNVLLIGLYFVFIIALFASLRNIINGTAVASTSDRFSGEGGFSILFGHLGVSLFFISLCLNGINMPKVLKNIMIVVGAIVGLYCMILSGSRGPFVAFIIVSLLYMLINTKKAASRLIIVFLLIIMGTTYINILEWVNNMLLSHDIYSFNRVYHTFTSGGDGMSGRDSYFLIAINDFLNHPFFGKSYLMDNGSYVHNIFIEQFRALGVVGGACFAIFTIYVLVKGYKFFKNDREFLIIYILFVQYVIYGCFSSTIIAIPQYWAGLYLVLNFIKQHGYSNSYNSNIRMQRPPKGIH